MGGVMSRHDVHWGAAVLSADLCVVAGASGSVPLLVTTSYPLTATTLSHYVRLERCERYLRLSVCREDLQALLPRSADLDIRPQPLTPLLQSYGGSFEEQVVASLPAGPLNLRASS